MISVTARSTGASVRCEVDLPAGRTLVVDEPPELGGEDEGPTPQQLVAAALASCVAVTVQMYARRKGWVLDGLRVDVDYDTEPRPREATVSLRLPDGLSADQRERLREVASRCPVSQTLTQGVSISETEPT